MSLLMEALRKAELEKKKAAQRLEETIEHAHVTENSGSHSVVPAPRTGETTAEQPITRMDPTYIRSREELLAATASLSLAPIEVTRPHAETGTPGASEDVTLNRFIEEPPRVLEEDGTRDTAPEADRTLDQAVLGETLDIGAAVPPGEASHDAAIDITSKLPGIYDETIRGEPFRPPERAYDETLPGVSAAELARDLGEENQPTPVAAQTIFTATATSRSAFGYKWPLIAALCAVALAVFGIILYQTQTPLIREIPQDQMIGDLDLSRLPAAAGETAAVAPAAQAPVAESVPEVAPPDQLPAAGADALSAAAAPPAGATPGEVPAVETVAAAPRSQPLTEAVPAGGESAAAAGAEILKQLPATLQVEPAMIKISRSKAPDGQGRQINEAYGAYMHGDYSGAGQKYAEVLQDFPDNRDALLGLGAIAIQSGDFTRAQEIYARLYRLNPGDTYARAVLLNLDSISDPVSRESALKIMIQDNPDSAYLHFSLGNVYAAQSRWAEAQQAFFDAYSNESDNADFAFNLAVSLDHIGQVKAALDYYHTALQLADDRPVQFDSANILARIQSLTSTN
jgi:tetratricopeptide (TPR) repeat protein